MGALIMRIPTKSVFIDSSMPNQNFGGFYGLFTGRFPPGTIYRTLISFDLSLLPIGWILSKAELNLNIIRNDYPQTTKFFSIHRLKQDYGEYTVTYGNQPSYTTDPYSIFSVENELDVYVKADVTELVQEWYSGRFTNFGMLLKAVDENTYNLISAYSRFAGDESYYPYLELTLETPLSIAGRQFISSVEAGLVTEDEYKFSQKYDVSQMINYTYFVTNEGVNPCDILSQVSPDGVFWIDDSKIYSLNKEDMVSVVPKTFSKYTRLAYKSSILTNSTTINMTLQQQM